MFVDQSRVAALSMPKTFPLEGFSPLLHRPVSFSTYGQHNLEGIWKADRNGSIRGLQLLMRIYRASPVLIVRSFAFTARDNLQYLLSFMVR